MLFTILTYGAYKVMKFKFLLSFTITFLLCRCITVPQMYTIVLVHAVS